MKKMASGDENSNTVRALEIWVKPLSDRFQELHKSGRLVPKRGFNLHHEKSYPGKDNYFTCFLLDVNKDKLTDNLDSFCLGVLDGNTVKLNLGKGEIMELWEARSMLGEVRAISIKIV